MPRLNSDLVELLMATWNGSLDECSLSIDPEYATTVVLVSGGYPGSYAKGHEIIGLDHKEDKTITFHAGTKLQDDQVVTSGGRVLAVTGRAQEIETALQRAYDSVSHITWNGMNYRKDIGLDLIKLKN